jgi:deazaflavin-dependent oxidoreductase (nitroreductase family)
VTEDEADQPFAWLTTIGRRTGDRRTVELWFVLDGRTIYFLAGGGDAAHWVRNTEIEPRVTVRLGNVELPGLARRTRPGGAEDDRARRSMAAKYQGWREGRALSGWASHALCIAVDLDPDRDMIGDATR